MSCMTIYILIDYIINLINKKCALIGEPVYLLWKKIIISIGLHETGKVDAFHFWQSIEFY